jgi:hypothetical protein
VIRDGTCTPSCRKSLAQLAERVRRGDRQAPEEFQARLSGELGPAVRLALRRGLGAPLVVKWVRQTFDELSGGMPVPPEQFAPQITRMLCDTLLRGLQIPEHVA